jgi:hypothetical protein
MDTSSKIDMLCTIADLKDVASAKLDQVNMGTLSSKKYESWSNAQFT